MSAPHAPEGHSHHDDGYPHGDGGHSPHEHPRGMRGALRSATLGATEEGEGARAPGSRDGLDYHTTTAHHFHRRD